jgi:hypothetical protein
VLKEYNIMLTWYVVEEDMTLTAITADFASEQIAVDDLVEVDSFYLRTFIDSKDYPVIIQDFAGLEGEMV